MGAVGKRKVGGSSNTRKGHKQRLRKGFRSRHIDQVWEDVHKTKQTQDLFTKDSKADTLGPLGTTDKAVIDEDVPGGGAFYCVECARYLGSEAALLQHRKTKPHKRRVKQLSVPVPPHDQSEADWAGGLGAPDNGQKLRPAAVANMEM